MEFSFVWQIENYSLCCQETRYTHVSPAFSSEILENTIWSLMIAPNSSSTEFHKQGDEYTSLYLERIDDNDGPDWFQINFELSLLDKDGSALRSIEINEDECAFSKYSSCGKEDFVRRNEVLFERKAEYLPHDTLTVCCRMWKMQEGIHKVGRAYARTRIGIEKVVLSVEASFLKRLEYDIPLTYDIQSSSKKTCIAKLNLYGTDGTCCDEKIIAEVILTEIEMVKLVSCAVCFIDIHGKRKNCGQADFGDEFKKKGNWKFPLCITKSKIMADLSSDALDRIITMEFELTFSNRLEIFRVERNDHGNPLPSLKSIVAVSTPCPSVLEDLKTLYDDKILCDIKLKTKSEEFPAHKMVLCARSPVFTAMLSSNMKEKITDCIKVDDMEDETVRQFLMFLYTGVLQNEEWEEVAQLYYAADKYQVNALKTICSNFLIDNLKVENVVEILLLADIHQDTDFKAAVQSFIHGHQRRVFCSDEWRKFAKSYSQLAMETLLLMYNE